MSDIHYNGKNVKTPYPCPLHPAPFLSSFPGGGRAPSSRGWRARPGLLHLGFIHEAARTNILGHGRRRRWELGCGLRQR
jgi:hypothetical protein